MVIFVRKRGRLDNVCTFVRIVVVWVKCSVFFVCVFFVKNVVGWVKCGIGV